MALSEDFDYRHFVDQLFVNRREGVDGFMHAAAGFAGEAGECLDLIKKAWAYNQPINREKLIEEMGDAMYYFMALLLKLEVGIEVPVEGNVAKLRKRYPNGYSDAAAIERADKKPARKPRKPRQKKAA